MQQPSMPPDIPPITRPLHGVAAAPAALCASRAAREQQAPHWRSSLGRDGARPDPPSYLVELALRFLPGVRFYRCDKSAWATNLVYEGGVWVVRDLRRLCWEVQGPPGATPDQARKLARKLASAGRGFERTGILPIVERMSPDELVLQSTTPRLRRLYGQFRKWLDVAEPPKPAAEEPGALSLLADLQRVRDVEHELDVDASALVLFFLAHLEVVFAACYALGDATRSPKAPASYEEFQRLPWRDRFNLVLPNSAGPNVSKLRQLVLDVVDTYRFVLGHAEPMRFVYIEALGRVLPANADELFSHRWLFFRNLTESDANRIIGVSHDLLEELSTNEATRYAYTFARVGLPIPLTGPDVMSLRQHMTSPADFEEELARRASQMSARARSFELSEALFQCYRTRVEESVQRRFQAVGKMTPAARAWAVEEAPAAAAFAFYLAYVESLFPACHMLHDDRGGSLPPWSEFDGLTWQRRLDLLLPDGSSNSAAAIKQEFEPLLDIRHELLHPTPAVLSFDPVQGYLPLASRRAPRRGPLGEREVQAALRMFDALDDELRTNQSTRFGYAYAHADLPIPLGGEAVADLRQYTASMVVFEEELHRRMDHQDRVDNMEV